VKILAILPARYASTRLPGKPLADILGKPMIQWVYEGVQACGQIDQVIVATDDKRILDAVRSFGGNAEMTSESHLNGTSRCAEVSARFPDYDYVINVQGDEPLINPKHLEALRAILADDTQIPNANKQLTDSESIHNSSKVPAGQNRHRSQLTLTSSRVRFNRHGTAHS